MNFRPIFRNRFKDDMKGVALFMALLLLCNAFIVSLLLVVSAQVQGQAFSNFSVAMSCFTLAIGAATVREDLAPRYTERRLAWHEPHGLLCGECRGGAGRGAGRDAGRVGVHIPAGHGEDRLLQYIRARLWRGRERTRAASELTS